MKILRNIWHWLNAEFGRRLYFKGENGRAYIKEGFNKPEKLFEHLRTHHPEEYEIVRRNINAK